MAASVVVRAVAPVTSRPALDLSLVVDLCGGVREDVADSLITSLVAMVERVLTPRDRLTIVSFGTKAQVVFTSESSASIGDSRRAVAVS